MSGSVAFVFVLAFCLVFCSANSGKSEKSTQTDPVTVPWIDWANIEVVDYLRAGGIVVAFVALILSDNRGKENIRRRKHNQWVNAEVIGWFGMGMIAYFFPANLLSYFTKTKLGMWHEVEMQNIGALLVANAVITARIQSSIESDALVHSSWLMSRVVGSASALFISVHAHFTDGHFTDQHLMIRCFGLLIWFIGNMYQVCTGPKVGASGPSRTAPTSGINRFILLELVFLLPLLIAALADPHAMYRAFTDHKMDSMVVHLAQCQAVIVITMSLQMLGVLYYNEDGVKKQFFFGRLLCLAMSFPVLFLYQWKSPMLTYNGFIGCAAMMLFQVGYSYLAYTYEDGPKLKSR